MTDYITHEAGFSFPTGWEDGTINVLRPADGKDEAKIVVLRAPRKGADLDAFVAFQRKDLVQRTPWFEPLSEGERTVAGERGLELRARYRDSGVELYQHRVTFARGGVFITLLCAAAAKADKECDALFERVVASVRFRERGGDGHGR
jgi:hypothetical protein